MNKYDSVVKMRTMLEAKDKRISLLQKRNAELEEALRKCVNRSAIVENNNICFGAYKKPSHVGCMCVEEGKGSERCILCKRITALLGGK